jgi:hypothetical protein
MLRGVAVLVFLLASGSVLAGEMSSDEARRFVVGKIFSYTCFEGTRGLGRVQADGSVSGSIQFQGQGQVRYANLPAGTLRVKGEAICASLRGLPIEPCFNLERTNNDSFRGSISGLSFAYCEFTRHHAQPAVAQNTRPTKSEHNTAHNTVRAERPTSIEQPLGLRPALTTEAN